MSNLSIYTRAEISAIECVIYEPVVCLILQGGKFTSIGAQQVSLRPVNAVLVSHDLPEVSRVTQASRQEPYFPLILSLDLGLVQSLNNQIAGTCLPDDAVARTLAACRAEPAWMAPLIRYCELMDNPLDAQILGPATLREIH